MTTQQMAALIEGYVEYGPKRIVSAEARFLFYIFWGFADPKSKQKSGQIRPLYFCVKGSPAFLLLPDCGTRTFAGRIRCGGLPRCWWPRFFANRPFYRLYGWRVRQLDA